MTVIIKDLPADWLTAQNEPALATIETELDKRIASIAAEVRGIVALSGQPQTDRALEAVADVDELLQAVANVEKYARSQAWPTMPGRLQKFEWELQLSRAMFVSFVSTQVQQAALGRFGDASLWAMHYSTVRLTLTTFFLTAAWGLTTVKWNDYTDQLYWAAWCIWILAGVFLLVFSALLFHANCRREKYSAQVDRQLNTDRRRRLVWFLLGPVGLPVVIFAVMTYLFYQMTHEWAKPENRSPNKTAILDGETEDTVAFSEWTTKLESIETSLKDVRERLSPPIQVATPTPSPTPTVSPTPSRKTSGVRSPRIRTKRVR